MSYLSNAPLIDIEVPIINRDSAQASGLSFVAPFFEKDLGVARCLPARKFSNLTFNGTGTTRTVGKVGRCIDLNGSGYLTGDDVNLFGGDGITFCGFASNRVEYTAYGLIFSSGVFLGTSTSSPATGLRLQVYNTAGSASEVSKVFTNVRRGLQDMFFFAMRYNLTTHKSDFCVNGEFEYRVSGVTITPSSKIITLGYFPGFGWNLNGQARDFRIYGRLLSDNLLLQIMKNPNELYVLSDEDLGTVVNRSKMFQVIN